PVTTRNNDPFPIRTDERPDARLFRKEFSAWQLVHPDACRVFPFRLEGGRQQFSASPQLWRESCCAGPRRTEHPARDSIPFSECEILANGGNRFSVRTEAESLYRTGSGGQRMVVCPRFRVPDADDAALVHGCQRLAVGADSQG